MTNPTPYDEVVTQALVRVVHHGDTRFGLITLTNGEDPRKPNTFGPTGLANLTVALDECESLVADAAIDAVAITSKPFTFSAGADLKAFQSMSSRDEVLAIARAGHAAFRRLGELSVPSFAFVNGLALGGGLEVALHCTYRTAARAAGRIALPEVYLGLVPGWGGTFLLPNLIGPDAAVTVMIENTLDNNRMLKPQQALELGVVDALFDGADFLESSLRWAAEVVTKAQVLVRPRIDRGEGWDAALERGRALADARTHGVPPAPYRALLLLENARHASRDDAFAAEDEALADLAMSPELAASLYAFDLVQRRGKRPVGAPDASLAQPVTSVGIMGAGLMASQLAGLFARRLLVPVQMVDVDEQRAADGVAAVHAEFARQRDKGRISPDLANRCSTLVTASTQIKDVADCDLVIEAVFEDAAVKRDVLTALEAVVSPECVLATNTSSLSVAQMASTLQHPERFVGIHFFNPVAVMPLVEVVRGPATNDATLATAFAITKTLRKSGVLVTDAPGFVVNRVLTRMLSEVWSAVDDGTPLPVVESALDPLGLPMSPLMLLQLVGPATALHVAQVMHDAFPDRFHVSESLRAIVAAGKTSLVTWQDAGMRLDPAIPPLLVTGDTPASAEQVRDRVLRGLAQEIDVMVSDRVVADAADVDLCLILGAGWPLWLGGITPYLDRTGVAEATVGHRLATTR